MLPEQDGVLGGMTVASLNKLTREQFGIHAKVEAGVVITAIESGSIAEQAGLRPGDVIVEINRQHIGSVQQFEKVYAKSKDSLLMLICRQNGTFYLVLRK
ncbi:MAG: PDZ domain-containing protein [Desulfobulbaceae bacterium]|jgi:serine protease Do|nr:PDZ domain-containing protein [Desulfobulbaceae bacterium]